MEKSVFSRSYDVFVTALRDARTEAKVTQVELAKRLGETQSFISKCERGERRLDVIELQGVAASAHTPGRAVDVGTLAAIALPDGAGDRRGNVAGAGQGATAGRAGKRRCLLS